MSRSERPTILVLYTELAPYVLACLNALVERADADVHLVRWPVNQEAPFSLAFHPRITVHERASLTGDAMVDLVARLRPALTITSGWVDKDYLRAAAEAKHLGGVSIIALDTAWRGHWKQWANALVARIRLHRSFTHAWVTGKAQAEYALRLGFKPDGIRTGFYSADTALFVPLGERILAMRNEQWPHRLLCVARYIPTKGHQLLCDAFAELCDSGDAGDWELHFAVTGELHEQVKASPSGMHPRITHLGFKQPEEMRGIVAMAGAFVLPSTYEPWGVVVQEHACAAVPLVLSSAVGASERFLKEGENGFRFIAGDKSSLKTALRMLMLSTDAELRAMGQRSMELGRAWSPAHWARTAHELMGDDQPATPVNLQRSTASS
ncbi:MAG: glycosyltransferase family 4 protein [Flavobacteriales bacterium]|nr:glycosyltransferase family 4 protein [Flavobacteriales bacterium]